MKNNLKETNIEWHFTQVCMHIFFFDGAPLVANYGD